MANVSGITVHDCNGIFLLQVSPNSVLYLFNMSSEANSASFPHVEEGTMI